MLIHLHFFDPDRDVLFESGLLPSSKDDAEAIHIPQIV